MKTFKTLVSLILVVSFSSASFADRLIVEIEVDRERQARGQAPLHQDSETDVEHSLLNDIIQSAVTETLKGQAINQSIAALDAQIGKIAADKGAQYLGNAFSLYAFVQGLLAFKDAKGEQEKYFAALSLAASIGSYILPAFSWVFQGALLSQQLKAGYVTKAGMKELMREEVDLQKLQLRFQQQVQARVEAELRFLQNLELQIAFHYEASRIIGSFLTANCSEPKKMEDVNQLYACIQNSRRVVYLNGIVARLLKEKYSLKLEFLSIGKIIEKSNLKKSDVDDLVAAVEKADETGKAALAETERKIRNRLQDLESNEIRTARIDDLAVKWCLAAAKTEVVPVLRSAKEFSTSDADDRSYLSLRLARAQETFKEKCGNLKTEKMPVEVQSFLQKLDQGMQSLSRQL